MVAQAGGTAKRKLRRKQILSRDAAIQKMKQWSGANVDSNPLATLHEAFEEEQDTEKFIGDTIFWKYFEDIDVRHIYKKSSIEFRNLQIMFFETVFFAFFLCWITAYVYELQSTVVYESRREQLYYWGGCSQLTDDAIQQKEKSGGGQQMSSAGKGVDCLIDRVVDVRTFWDWMEGELVRNAFQYGDVAMQRREQNIANITTSYNQNEFKIKWSPRYVGGTKTNVLLGAIRVRQLRVQNNRGCRVSSLFRHIFPDCYGAFFDKVQSTTFYAQRYTPTYTHDAYKWKSKEETLGVPIEGVRGELYPGDGFVFDLPLNRTETYMMIKDLYEWDWVDRATRAVVVELSVLNTNVNVIVNNRILFEFGPTGSVRAKHLAYSFRVLLLSPAVEEGQELSVFLYELMVIGLFIIYTVFIVWLAYKTGLKFPFYGWNIVDLIILALFYTTMYYRAQVQSSVSSEPNLQPDTVGHPELFMPFSKVMGALESSFEVLSFLSLCCWVKVFKYLCLCGWFRLLVRVIERCAEELVVFSLLLLVIFFGFAVAFFVGFGDSSEVFSTLDGSFLVLFFMLLGGFKVETSWFGPGESSLRPILFLAYLILVYFILFNIFMAIVLDAYTLVKILHTPRKPEDGDDPEERKNPMLVFLYAYYHHLKGISLVRDDDENLSFEEQQIELGLLPGIVARKWIEKKRKMQRMVDESRGDVGNENDDEEYGMDGGEKKDKRRYTTLARLKRRATTMVMGMPAQQEDTSRNHGNDIDASHEMYHLPSSAEETVVSRMQLQRLMDEDETLCLLLGTRKALDVIRRFRGMEKTEEDEENGGDAVASLQDTVFRKLDTLEKSGLDLEAEEVAAVRDLSDQMTEAFTEVQNQWRQELTTTLEAAAALSEGLIELTQGLERVGANHRAMVESLEASESGTSRTSRTSSS